ncbi:type I methionyl aminopeptidase [Candidatus Microgenomates bacterium]|nr:type I methionyl aminopeptidase [Candidatus Microgenomates bacterium]
MTYKTDKEISILKEGGRILASILSLLQKFVEENYSRGITAIDVDGLAEKLLKEAGATPSFKGFHSFPASLCVSINDEVVHGIPTKDKIFREGDLVSLDIGARYKNLYTDMAVSFVLGQGSDEARKLVAETKNALMLGIAEAKVGNKIGDIGFAIEDYLAKFGYGIVRNYTGHGVGHGVHEDPPVPNYGKKGTGEELKVGMVLAIEPMVTLKGEKVSVDADGWTVRAIDGSYVAHWEHTVAVTEKGPVILTE